MFKSLRDLLAGDTSTPLATIDLEQAAAALMIEVARADESIDHDELKAVANRVALKYQLSEAQVDDIVAAAQDSSEQATSLYEFTQIINKQLSDDEKVALIYDMWLIAWADNTADEHEEYLIRKVADLIYVPHTKYVQARNKARPSGV